MTLCDTSLLEQGLDELHVLRTERALLKWPVLLAQPTHAGAA
jgi:hypothetical protein